MSTEAASTYVVTFNPVDDFRGLRRMTLADARELAAYAQRRNLRRGRIVNVETGEHESIFLHWAN